MTLERTRSQTPAKAGPASEDRGEAPKGKRGGEVRAAGNGDGGSGCEDLLSEVLARDNMWAALRRVKQNGGSAGVDGVTVDELPDYLRQHWPRIREELFAGRYVPQQVLRREIPKSGGGVRELGIPTVLDRLIQQAILQVLQPRIDPSFSDHSYGFRPGRRAHDAVRRAQQYIQDGRSVVVDIDLERFFDRVNHDVLMERLARRVADRRLLRLIRRYLGAGVMVNAVAVERYEGTPQGGPLSPLLANVLLDEVDKELEKRGHAFVRYADDCNVYVQTRRAGERVMESLRRLYAGLRLRVNETKSAVAPARNRKFLGYSFWAGRGGAVRLRVADKAMATMKDRIRQSTGRNGGRSLPQVAAELRSYLTGWKAYFRLAQTRGVFAKIDEWIRHRMRTLQLKQWKRGKTIFRELRARGMSQLVAATVAANARRWARNSRMYLHLAIRNTDLDALGVPRLAA